MKGLTPSILSDISLALASSNLDERHVIFTSLVDAATLGNDPATADRIGELVRPFRAVVGRFTEYKTFTGWSVLPEELRDNIRHHMDFETLCQLALTSRVNRGETRAVVRKRVENLLQHFHLSFLETMEVMKAHKAIISGLSALAMVLNFTFVPDQLEFFVPSDASIETMITRLSEKEDYRRILKPRINRAVPWDYDDADICRVVWLVHAGTGRRITIYQVSFHQPLNYIFCFYTTLMMNAITPHGVGCAYPELTVRKVGLVHRYIRHDPSTLASVLTQYTKRGLSLAENWECPRTLAITADHDCATFRSCSHTNRSTRSKKGLLWMSFEGHPLNVLKADVPYITWSPLPFDP